MPIPCDYTAFNNDILMENLSLKDTIRTLNTQLDMKTSQIAELNQQLLDKDVAENYRREA